MSGIVIFQGDAREVKITCKDADGIPINPTNLVDIKVWVYQKSDQVLIGKWSLVPDSDFGEITIAADNKVRFILTSEQTLAAEIGILVIQVSVSYTDDESDFEELRISKKGILGTILYAKNE